VIACSINQEFSEFPRSDNRASNVSERFSDAYPSLTFGALFSRPGFKIHRGFTAFQNDFFGFDYSGAMGRSPMLIVPIKIVEKDSVFVLN